MARSGVETSVHFRNERSKRPQNFGMRDGERLMKLDEYDRVIAQIRQKDEEIQLLRSFSHALEHPSFFAANLDKPFPGQTEPPVEAVIEFDLAAIEPMLEPDVFINLSDRQQRLIALMVASLDS